jgi:prepilin-type N-terminal cleavage/methylation domain-containing protein
MNRILHRPWRIGARRVFRRLRAFTLLEVMVAVAALAVLAVGIAAVFDVTGRTVTGGRRISAINAYANLLQQQMEADFAAMTRDGFLVIRNQHADVDGDGVAQVPTTAFPTPAGTVDLVRLHSEDRNPRPRRVDELMFFAKGSFTSAREPLHPQLIPTSDAARIYYGHGERARRDGTPAPTNAINPNYFWRPDLSDSNIDQYAQLGRQVPDPAATQNPNAYAAEWTLLRHVTLLVPRSDGSDGRPPQNSRPALTPTSLFANPNANNFFRLLDSEIQVAGQPAASSIFRAISVQFPTDFSPNLTTPTGTYLNPASYALRRGNDIRPQFSSGLIDIATVGLGDIRAVVMTADTWPGGPPVGFPGFPAGPNFFLASANANEDGSNAGVDRKYRRHGTGPNQDPFLIQRTHAWMSDAFPTRTTGVPANQRRRVRYEPIPPNLIGASSGAGLTGGFISPEFETALRRADQAMLASWGFIPRCTEFIVEWSFGRTIPSDPTSPLFIPGRAGELIWHGLERMPNPANLNLGANNLPLAWPRGVPFAGGFMHGALWGESADAPALLIHGIQDWAQYNPAGPLNSYFGYIDPLLQNPTLQNPTRPWPWPKFIRITLSLADPRDPSLEQTFQFVFNVPQQES